MQEQQINPSSFPLTISRIFNETPDVKTFVFDSCTTFSFSAGQYLTFIFSINGQELRRSYSISSSPVKGEPLAITFRRIPNGIISRLMFDSYVEGDVLYTSGPGGFFLLPEVKKISTCIFFFAAGTGIVPVFSLLKTLLNEDQVSTAVLIYSSKTLQQCIYFNPLKELEEHYGNRLTIHFLFSNDREVAKARLNAFLLEDFMRRYQMSKNADSFFYLCGPAAYMRMIEFELRTSGIEQDKIRKENFDTAKPLISHAPPDINPHQVEINFQGNIHHLMVRYPVSILAEAKKNKIDLPYSCEAGKCGNCVAKCVKGKVWMLYNEVLTDKDLAKGFVLTCNSFPIEGNVSLSF